MRYVIQTSKKAKGYDTEDYDERAEALRELGCVLSNIGRYTFVAYIVVDDDGKIVSDTILYDERHTLEDEIREEILAEDE